MNGRRDYHRVRQMVAAKKLRQRRYIHISAQLALHKEVDKDGKPTGIQRVVVVKPGKTRVCRPLDKPRGKRAAKRIEASFREAA